MSNEQSQTLAALQKAIQMEIDGKKYYLQLGRTGADEAGRKLFSWLAEQEDIHLKNFKKIFHDLEAGRAWPKMGLAENQPGSWPGIFKLTADGNKGSTSSELKSIDKAMGMENQTLDYYLAQAAKAIFPLEKQYYEAVAAQERIHHALLLDYFEFLKDPAQYFTMKERHSLDGG